MSHLDRTRHISKFGGIIWYVSKDYGDNANNGRSPEKAFETIGTATAIATSGDAISIMAGVYTETGLTLGDPGVKDNLEMWFEIGVVIDPATGTALTIAGDHCRLTGGVFITPAPGQVGLLLSGDFVRVGNFGGPIISGGAVGIRITGVGIAVHNGACPLQTSIGYDIQGDLTRLYDCSTAGNSASIGFYINNSADDGTLRNCTSTGHETSGYSVATGSEGWTMHHCSSGNGDGRWVDYDHNNVWSTFHYDDFVAKQMNAETGQTQNLFKVTGTIKISAIVGHVKELIVSAGAPNMWLSVFSANGEVDLTLEAGPNIAADVVGTVYIRNADVTGALVKGDNNNTPFIIENSDYRDPQVAVIVGADDAADTFIRYNAGAACSDGIIHWHCNWEPVTNGGFLEPV